MKVSIKLVIAMAIGCISLTGCQSHSPGKALSTNMTQGNQLAKDGLYKEAIENYQRELKHNPEETAAHRNLGITYLKIGNYKKASFHLKKSIIDYSSDSLVNFYLAEAYRAQDEFADAIYYYRKSLDLNPNNDKALKALAWSYYQTRYYSEAFKIAKKLKTLAPDDSQTAIITARIMIKMGSSQKALALIQKTLALSSASDMPYLKSTEGDVYLALKDCNNAEGSYRAALQQDPLLAGALLGLGRCLLLNETQTVTAISYLERSVRLKPQLAEGYYFLGKSLEKTKPLEAMKYFKTFMKLAAGNPEYRIYMADVRQKLNSTTNDALNNAENGKRNNANTTDASSKRDVNTSNANSGKHNEKKLEKL